MKVAVTTLASTVAALLGLGLVMLYSSSMTKVGTHDLFMQLVWVGLGFGLCVTAALRDYAELKELRWVLYGGSLVMLLLVFAPLIGHGSHGAHRWIGRGHVTVQPSEFVKIALIIVLAWYGDRYQRQMPAWIRGVLYPVLLIAPVLALIFREPDRGQTILLSSVCLGMLLVAGVRWRCIIIPASLALGITLLICLQAAINIGVVTSALPNKGLPLPFISYGGSNLLAMFTCLGILFSIARQAEPVVRLAPVPVVTEENPFTAKTA